MADLKGKSLLGLQGVTKENIELILRSARKMKDIEHVLGTEYAYARIL